MQPAAEAAEDRFRGHWQAARAKAPRADSAAARRRLRLQLTNANERSSAAWSCPASCVVAGRAPPTWTRSCFRGNYWRDRNTRVCSRRSTLEGSCRRHAVSAHYLLDAITSASVAAGVVRSAVHRAAQRSSASVGQSSAPVLRPRTRTRPESDYWAHLVSVGCCSISSSQHDSRRVLFLRPRRRLRMGRTWGAHPRGRSSAFSPDRVAHPGDFAHLARHRLLRGGVVGLVQTGRRRRRPEQIRLQADPYRWVLLGERRPPRKRCPFSGCATRSPRVFTGSSPPGGAWSPSSPFARGTVCTGTTG